MIFRYLTASHTFIFMNRKDSAKQLCSALREQKHDSKFISSDLSRTEREEFVRQFKEGSINVLICTNNVARGLDISVARCVVNFDMPLNNRGQVNLDTYMHRQGRYGVVINFITNRNEELFVARKRI